MLVVMKLSIADSGNEYLLSDESSLVPMKQPGSYLTHIKEMELLTQLRLFY